MMYVEKSLPKEGFIKKRRLVATLAIVIILATTIGVYVWRSKEADSELESTELIDEPYFPVGARSGVGDVDGNVLWTYDVVQPVYVNQGVMEGSDTEGSYTYLRVRYVDDEGESKILFVLISYLADTPSYVEKLGKGYIDYYRLSYSEMVRLWSSLDWGDTTGEGDWVLAEAIEEKVVSGQQIAIKYLAEMPDIEYRTDEFCSANPLPCAHAELIEIFSDGVTDFRSDEWKDDYVLVPEFLSLDLY